MTKIKIILVILIGISLPLYVLWRITLVEFDYSSISEAQSGVKITSQIINDQELLVFPEEENYYFDKINLEIILKKEIASIDKLKLEVYQNFLVSFYPKSEKVLNAEDLKNLLFQDNTTDLPAGSLFFNGDAISILLPGDSYRSIFSAELFEKMGYKWEDVISKEVGFAGKLEAKENFLYGNAHPSGTFVQIKNNFFLVWNKELFLIESNLNLRDFSLTSPVKIDSINPVAFDSCETMIQKNKMTCSFNKKNNLTKSNYIFISDLKTEDIKEAKINLSTNPSWWSLRNNFLVSVDNIKLKLIKKYRGYIPFI